MRLTHFSVQGLFGLFHHDIPFEMENRITLVHAPNGYGKTVILKMIAGLFGSSPSLNIFRNVEFEVANFHFDDGSRLLVQQGSPQPELAPLANPERPSTASFRLTYEKAGVIETFDPAEEAARKRVGFSPELLRDFATLPAPGYAQYARTFDVEAAVSAGEIASSLAKLRWKRSSRFPAWLQDLRKSLHCRLIETQRLVSVSKKGSDGEPALTPVVKTCASELSSSIRALLARSATLAQLLDQSFPGRIVAAVGGDAPTEDYLKLRLTELEQKRARLAAVALVDANTEPDLLSYKDLTPTTRAILAEYINDTSSKLNAYDEMLAKLEIFTKILNDRFMFKKIKIDRAQGFLFQDYRGREVSPEMLSSGEQHELVLLYDLLFRTKRNSLILIDEPEISLHVEWQRRFLSDIQQVIELTGIDVLICTHSPQLIASHIETAVVLRAPQHVP
jgi:energy-coupling factor transporter ATP-binding protein EcfA2